MSDDLIYDNYNSVEKDIPIMYFVGWGNRESVFGTLRIRIVCFFLELKKCFAYTNLDYKKYLKIDKKLFRPSKTVSLSSNTNKAKKILNYKVKTNLNKLIAIMMENDLKIEEQNNN